MVSRAAITAANKTYVVTFDGAVVTVVSKRNPGRVLRRIPANELVGVNFVPAGRIFSGRLTLRSLSLPTPYDVITFRAGDQLMFTAVARAIHEHIGETTSADAGSALAAMRQHARARRPTNGDRALTRAFGARSSPAVPLLVVLACVLFIGVLAMWLSTR
jgi:hypothetical protein